LRIPWADPSISTNNIYIPDGGYILATKILSGREKDLDDIKVLLAKLGITTRKQAESLLKKYVSRKTREDYTQDIQATLDHFFE